MRNWMRSRTVSRAFAEHCGRMPFSFEHRPNFSTHANHAVGTLAIENAELTLHLNNGPKVNSVSLSESTAPFFMPKNEDFSSVSDDTRPNFRTIWMALREKKKMTH
ncbi:hypothetical protein DQ04_05101050 [Trypanosoma grayi]|uniref:hypothetical protein n=1 Tax=Trypanosoma grayi TaxID=71804 RepID=UPI0004F40033|nr:hypothetical protein DQ04_05101050 [Trypanosoma grayi]KEG09513.1 hypothetical protein DQ04_05101050 [Trypanosoma grayi]